MVFFLHIRQLLTLNSFRSVQQLYQHTNLSGYYSCHYFVCHLFLRETGNAPFPWLLLCGWAEWGTVNLHVPSAQTQWGCCGEKTLMNSASLLDWTVFPSSITWNLLAGLFLSYPTTVNIQLRLSRCACVWAVLIWKGPFHSLNGVCEFWLCSQVSVVGWTFGKWAQ